MDFDRAIKTARQVALAAGELLKEGWRQNFAIENKGEVDLVTEYDRRSEALVVEALSKAFPQHTVVGEEGTEIKGNDTEAVWYVDPLDGTTNYAHHLPFYNVSIGLEREGKPCLGVVYVPEMGWEFWAVKGQGAYLGDKKIQVSKTESLNQSLVATGFPYDRRVSTNNNVPEFAEVIRHCQGVRRFGVASLDCVMVAWGKLDAYWELKLKPWDISAGAIIVEEAGGKVTAPDGGDFSSTDGNILATNGLVHQELADILIEVNRRK